MSFAPGDGVRRSTRTSRSSTTPQETPLPAPRSARKTRGTTPVVNGPTIFDASSANQRREVLSGRNQGYGTIGEAGISRTGGDRVATQQQVASSLDEVVENARSDMAKAKALTDYNLQAGNEVEDRRSNRSNRSSKGNQHLANRAFNHLESVVEEGSARHSRSIGEEDGDSQEEEDEAEAEAEAEESEAEREAETFQDTITTSMSVHRQKIEEALHRTFNMEGWTRNSGNLASSTTDGNQNTRFDSGGTKDEGKPHRCLTTSELWRHSLLTMIVYSSVCLLALGALNRYRGRPFLDSVDTTSAGNVTYQGSTLGYSQSMKSALHEITKLGKRISTVELSSKDIDSDIQKLQDDVWGVSKLVRTSTPDSPPIRQVNFLSPVEMAAVDPRLTSPTATRPVQGWAMGAVAKLSGGILADQSVPIGLHEYVQEDNTILRRNWCSNSVHGVAQKGWQLGYNMTPTELVLGWPAKGETVDGRSAPRDIELWIDLAHNSDGAAYIEHTKTLADATWPGIMDAPTFPHNQNHNGAIRSSSSTLVPHTMVPIGKWRYDFHAKKREQRFPVTIDIKHRKTDRVALRITSNWGSERMVCLQDVALHGYYRGQPIEYAE